MSKTKTKTKKAVSKKAKKASAEAGVVMIGGREWKRSKFGAYFGRGCDRRTVEGFIRGDYGIFEFPAAAGSVLSHLVTLKHQGVLLAIFEDLQSAAVAALIEEALDGWPTALNEYDGRSFRDEALWASGFCKGGSFCYESSMPVWGLEDETALKPARSKAA